MPWIVFKVLHASSLYESPFTPHSDSIRIGLLLSTVAISVMMVVRVRGTHLTLAPPSRILVTTPSTKQQPSQRAQAWEYRIPNYGTAASTEERISIAPALTTPLCWTGLAAPRAVVLFVDDIVVVVASVMMVMLVTAMTRCERRTTVLRRFGS